MLFINIAFAAASQKQYSERYSVAQAHQTNHSKAQTSAEVATES
jgi:hypothetical protein